MTDNKTNDMIQHTESQPTESQTNTTPKHTKPSTKKEKSGGNALGGIAIVLVIALGAGLYYHGHTESQRQENQIAALTGQLNSFQQNFAQSQQIAQSQLQAVVQANASDQQQVQLQQQAISALQNTVNTMKGRSPSDWLLAEADYLINMASRQLWIDHDVVSATLLMEAADKRIVELNEPSLRTLRQAIINDITTLKALPEVDRDGIVLQMLSLQQSITTLPLANAILPPAEATDTPVVTQSVENWKENVVSSLKNFADQFITYRRRDGNVMPLLSPKQDFYLEENIKAKLETAITAVYQEQGPVYHQALSMAIEWASQYYDMSSPATQSFIATLKQLNQETIVVHYPSALQSQPLINAALNARLRGNTPSAVVPTSQAVPVKKVAPLKPITPQTKVLRLIPKKTESATITTPTTAITSSTKEVTKVAPLAEIKLAETTSTPAAESHHTASTPSAVITKTEEKHA